MAEAKRLSKIKISDKKSLQTKNAFADNDIDLLLVGKTGNGKSATGNSILGQIKFESEPSTESVTTNIEYAVVEYKKRKIKVVDGPGIGDTHNIDDLGKATEYVMKKMSDAVTLNPDGYHAFLLVVKFGNRLTAEDKECIRILKAIFGESFVKNYCILLVTNGDQFYKSVKQKGTSFKKWCQNQGGIFQELYTECNKRAVLFNNEAEDSAVKKKQRKKLVNTVDELQQKGRRYTNDYFQMAFSSREQLMVKVKEPRIRQDVLDKIDMLMQRKRNIRSKDIEVQITEMKELKEEVQTLFYKVQEADNQSGVLNDLIRNVKYALGDTEDNIAQIQQLVMERKSIVERKEEVRKLVFDEGSIGNELKSKFEEIMIENGIYNEEIQKLEKEIEHEEIKLKKDYKFREDQMKKKYRKNKGLLKFVSTGDEEFTDSAMYQDKLQQERKYAPSECENLKKEKLEAFSRIEKRKQQLEEKKQIIRDEIMTQLIGKLVNERQQEEMVKLFEEIDKLAKEFDQKVQKISNSSEEKDQNLMDKINEMKDSYIDELKKVKSKSKQKCPIQ